MSYYENPSDFFGKSFGSGSPEPVLPKLRSDLVVRKVVLRNEVSYMVKDPVTLAYYQLRPYEYDILSLLNGNHTDEEIIQEYNEKHPLEIIDEEFLESFKKQFREMELLEVPPPQKSLMLMERIRAQRKIRKRATEGDIFFLTLSAWNPNSFFNRIIPHIRFFWTKQFFVISLMCVLLMLTIYFVKWDEFKEGIIKLYSFHEKSLWDILVFVMLTFVAGTIHECAHGLTLKNYGGDVYKMGFLLFYFTPAFYVDVSDGYLLASRKKRMLVTLAGSYSELVICSLASFVWFFAVPGTVIYNFSFTVVLFMGISAALVNMNPLVKLDGYYMLMDTVEIPDLREEAFDFVKRWFKKNLFGLEVEERPDLTRRMRRIFVAYASLAMLYTLSLYLLIVFWIRNIYLATFKQFGYILLLITLFFLFRKLLRQIRDFTKFVYLDKKEVLMKKKTAVWSGFSIAALALLLFLPRTHTKISDPFVVEPSQHVEIRAETDGFIEKVLVKENDSVETGQVLAKMSNRELKQDGTRLDSQLELLNRELYALQSARETNKYQMKLRTQEQLVQEKTQLNRKIEKLTLKATIAGKVVTPRLEDRVGIFAAKGTLFCVVDNLDKVKIQIPVREYEIEDVKPGQRVLLKFNAYPTETFEGHVVQISSAITERVEALERTFTRFNVTVLIENQDGRLIPGMDGDAKILAEEYSIAARIKREVGRWVKSKIW